MAGRRWLSDWKGAAVSIFVGGAAVALLCASEASSAPLTTSGLGPVKIGMTVREAERSLGRKLHAVYAPDGNACETADLTVGNTIVLYMIEDRRITRIDVFGKGVKGKHTRSFIRTARGVGVGSTETDVLRAYGPRVVVTPHPYLEAQGHYLTVDDPGHRRGIIFETDHGVITSYRAGEYPSLGYIEGCL